MTGSTDKKERRGSSTDQVAATAPQRTHPAGGAPCILYPCAPRKSRIERTHTMKKNKTIKTATAEQIKANFLVTEIDKLEARREIFDAIDKTWTQERAADMCIAIMKDLEETVKAEGGSLDDWTEVDRVTWAVKQAYCLGYCQGWATTMEAQEIGFIELFGADALGCKPGGVDFTDDDESEGTT